MFGNYKPRYDPNDVGYGSALYGPPRTAPPSMAENATYDPRRHGLIDLRPRPDLEDCDEFGFPNYSKTPPNKKKAIGGAGRGVHSRRHQLDDLWAPPIKKFPLNQLEPPVKEPVKQPIYETTQTPVKESLHAILEEPVKKPIEESSDQAVLSRNTVSLRDLACGTNKIGKTMKAVEQQFDHLDNDVQVGFALISGDSKVGMPEYLSTVVDHDSLQDALKENTSTKPVRNQLHATAGAKRKCIIDTSNHSTHNLDSGQYTSNKRRATGFNFASTSNRYNYKLSSNIPTDSNTQDSTMINGGSGPRKYARGTSLLRRSFRLATSFAKEKADSTLKSWFPVTSFITPCPTRISSTNPATLSFDNRFDTHFFSGGSEDVVMDGM